MKYLVQDEDGKDVYHVATWTFPFVPTVGDAILNNGLEVVVLKRSFEFSEPDAQWVGKLIVRVV